MDVVRRLEQAEYYVDLLFKMIDEEKCPFYSLIIKKKARKKDIERILKLCERLNEQYVVEKAEGLLLFDALLNQFEKALPHQLEVHETAEALAKQGLFVPLMNEFLRMIAKG
ncbi:YhaI family protein [Bacillus cereus group sp. BfR-BA-01523]|uniref:YhaI family protein n=1 Tax=Bacillus cereus group sp. BfR-BA-01523 TaxID=2920371 RepID=UPI001F573185|nr:YhaI family protein [Bacillus cereus group sp. BfR-BA-01523]